MDQRPGWNPPPAPGSPELSSTEVVSSRPRRSRIGTGAAVAAVAIGALGIAGTAYAATASNSPAPTPNGTQGYDNRVPDGPGGMMGGQPGGPGGMMGDRDGDRGHGRGGMGFGMGLGQALHGSGVVAKQGGGYQTVDMQRGVVTAVSSDSITVKSEDGFSATYAVTAETLVNAQKDGIASVKVGDEVGVMAVENAGSKDAVQIMDRTQMKANHDKYAPAAPSPKPSQTA